MQNNKSVEAPFACDVRYHFDTLDQRESVLDKSHITHLSVRYKKYRTLILINSFQDIITYCMHSNF